MKKIVHLVFSLEVGGTECLLVDIANEQAQLARVAIIIINQKYNTGLLNRIDPIVKCYTLNREPGSRWSLLFLAKLWVLLLRINPTVIHCHQHSLIRLLPWFRKRSVLTVHCLEIATEHLKKYKQVYAISAAVAMDIRQRAGIRSPVIPNGIHFIQVSPKLDYAPGKEMSIRIVQVGRLDHTIKGQDLLLQALQHVLADEQYRKVSVDFIGAGSSQAYLEEMSASLGIKAHVCFLGEKPRSWIYQHLAGYDIMVQPSRSEGFGLTILEGIAAGLPVIASDHAGPREILQQMPGSYLFRSEDVKELALSIQKIAGQIRDNKVQALCTVSRSLASRQYSIRNTAHEYLKYYSTAV